MFRPATACLLALIASSATLLGCGFSSPPNGNQHRIAAQPSVTGASGKDEIDLDAQVSTPLLTGAQAQATHEAWVRTGNILESLSHDDTFALGNEDCTAYGVGWQGDQNRSDIASVCGTPPAVYGWDLFGIELGNPTNGDGVDFGLMCQRMQEAHRINGINTVSWHVHNPVSGGDAWDRTEAVASILPGGTHHAIFRDYLDRVANFFTSCRGDSGELLPILFRPFHEHSGDWFWWGVGKSTDEEFVALWRFVVDYLRQQRHLDQLRIVFSPYASDVNSAQDYLFRYPGDTYVDVMGIDGYYGNNAAHLVAVLEMLVEVADAHGKWPALTEFGVIGSLSNTNVDTTHWFTKSFLVPLQQSPSARRIAYALAWRNASLEQFYVPYPGHTSAADFKALCDDPHVLLGNEMTGRL